MHPAPQKAGGDTGTWIGGNPTIGKL